MPKFITARSMINAINSEGPKSGKTKDEQIAEIVSLPEYRIWLEGLAASLEDMIGVTDTLEEAESEIDEQILGAVGALINNVVLTGLDVGFMAGVLAERASADPGADLTL